MINEAKDLMEAIEKFEMSADGDSNDEEHDAAVDMAVAARAFLRKTAERNVEVADLVDQFEMLRLRRERIDYYLPETSVARLDNEYPIPAMPCRYFAIEKSDDTGVWAMGADTLEELAMALDESETSRTGIEVWDLDIDPAGSEASAAQLTPVENVAGFYANGKCVWAAKLGR
jgi:hypothetical protein